MHDARAVFHRHIIAGDYTESPFSGVDPRDKLLVMHAGEVAALIARHHFVRHEFVSGLVILKFKLIGSRLENTVKEGFRHHYCNLLAIIGIKRTHRAIINRRPHAESAVRRQSPRRSRPGQEIRRAPPQHVFFRICNTELSYAGGVFNIAIASGLVQFMRTQARTRHRRIRLDSIAFIKIILFVQLCEEPPHALYIAVIVSDIGILEIHPIAHLVGKFRPLTGVFHHLGTTGGIIIVYAYFGAYVFFLDSEILFHAKFHRQAMGVPSGFTLDLIASHCFIAAHHILYGSGNDMMNAWLAVGRRRAFVKHK